MYVRRILQDNQVFVVQALQSEFAYRRAAIVQESLSESGIHPGPSNHFSADTRPDLVLEKVYQCVQGGGIHQSFLD